MTFMIVYGFTGLTIVTFVYYAMYNNIVLYLQIIFLSFDTIRCKINKIMFKNKPYGKIYITILNFYKILKLILNN